ncbi:uncharacterized protein LOC142494668 [Ascaphus truei]|uniref:uncharacterized protein LOC142494668 n=1 Tax=Ascaphus truei TaxID=8439 RepID=UPI003F5AD62F
MYEIPTIATFYTLPKIHKNQERPPGRPIVSGNNNLTENTSRYLDRILRPFVLALPSYIKDTKDTLLRLNGITTGNDTWLVTLDVESLYTSILHTSGLTACNYFLSTRHCGYVEHNKLVLNLLTFVLTHNYFLFDGLFYHQTQGTAMGTSCAPTYANLYLGCPDIAGIPTGDQSHKVAMYADDVILTLSKHCCAPVELQNLIWLPKNSVNRMEWPLQTMVNSLKVWESTKNRYGVEPPVLVKLEKEIELEETLLIESGPLAPTSIPKSCCHREELSEAMKHIAEDPPCNCSHRFSIEYLSEGRYRLGDKIIFIRMLHGKHVMVRVGGGWDTLQGFLLKYDPCRVLQFSTLEQKILQFQKGGKHENVSRTPRPPVMNPLSAVGASRKPNSNVSTPMMSSKTNPRNNPSPALTSQRGANHVPPAAVRPKVQSTQRKGSPLFVEPQRKVAKKLTSPQTGTTSLTTKGLQNNGSATNPCISSLSRTTTPASKVTQKTTNVQSSSADLLQRAVQSKLLQPPKTYPKASSRLQTLSKNISDSHPHSGSSKVAVSSIKPTITTSPPSPRHGSSNAKKPEETTKSSWKSPSNHPSAANVQLSKDETKQSKKADIHKNNLAICGVFTCR